MLNIVEKMVSTAKDMEMIRKGKDVFKLGFLITCVEGLYELQGEKAFSKDMIVSFFEENLLEKDRQTILEKFKKSNADDEFFGVDKDWGEYLDSSIREFAGVLNEYRNIATHEGNYENWCFNNNGDGVPVMMFIPIDLQQFSRKNKKEHVFETLISYREFERIFIRTAIQFVCRYVEEKRAVEPEKSLQETQLN